MRRAALTLAALAIFAPSLPAQCPDGSLPPCGPRPQPRAAASPTSIAVLYFENLSRDTADAYLADGLTEELTGRLGDVERLRVSGRSAVRRAQQASGDDLAAVGRALNVRYLVEGSLRRSGPQVRISTRLLRASDGVRVWGDTYDRTMTDLLALQEDIAREVAANVAGQLLPDERARLASRPTDDPQAYDHYLRGSYAVGRRSEAGFQRAVAEFDLALRRDPRFAAAEARKAYALVMSFAYGAEWASRDSLLAWGTRSAARAIRLDSLSPDAWMARGVAATWFEHDLPTCVADLRRAAELGPRNAEVQHSLGVALMWIGEDTAATASFRRALALDPLRAVTLLDLAEGALVTGDPASAGGLIDSAITLDPDQARPYMYRAGLRLDRGDLAGALADAETGRRLATTGIRPYAVAALVAVSAALGDTAAARAHLAELAAIGPTAPLGRALLVVGATDSALTVLERVEPLPISWLDLRLPGFEAVRTVPRFQRIEARWRDVALHRR